MKRVQGTQLPKIYCPFVVQVNPHVHVAQQHLLEWVQRMQLIQEEEKLRRFAAVRIGWLVARTYPTSVREELELLADWLTWLFIVDDQFSEGALSTQPDFLFPIIKELLAVIETSTPPEKDRGPIITALYDLWQRTRVYTTDAWQRRFMQHLAEGFVANCWEAQNRAQSLILKLESYREMRRISGGILLAFDFIDMVEHIELPLSIRLAPMRLSQDFQSLLHITNRVVCWTNDLFSLEKEMAKGDVNNIVLVVQHEHSLTLEQAMQYVCALITTEIDRFLLIEQRFSPLAAPLDQDINRYLLALHALMRGNLDWSSETARYAGNE